MKNYIIPFIILYLSASFIEHIYHRFIMHNSFLNEGKRHIQHHIDTDINTMSLVGDNIEYDEIVFPLYNIESYIFLIPLLLQTFILYYFYPIPLNFFVLLFISITLFLYAILCWNTIHPFIHNENAKKYTELSLNHSNTQYLVDNVYLFKWIIDNHKKHHIIKGNKKGNFNITLPGADFIMGTYN